MMGKERGATVGSSRDNLELAAVCRRCHKIERRLLSLGPKDRAVMALAYPTPVACQRLRID
jgi:hypothetical protein